MTYYDTLATFSTNQDLTGVSTVAQVSTDSIDLTQARGLHGKDLAVEFLVGTAFTTAGTPILQLGIVTADNAALSSGAIIHLLTGGPTATPYLTVTQLVANARIIVPVPYQCVAISRRTAVGSGGWPAGASQLAAEEPLPQRYLGVVYYNANAAAQQFSAGTITARLVMGPRRESIYPAGI